MSKISFHKVTASPVAPYAPNALYFFKSGTGFDLLLTDSAGEAILGLNKPSTTTATTSQESNDLKAIAALTGTTGLLRKTAAGTWSLDTSAYLTGISAKMVTDALNYTPVNPSVLGKADGIATLDAGGKVPSAQLPSFVDDVVDVANFASLPATGEKSKIYLLETPHSVGGITSSQFRWSGAAYAPIVASPGSTDAVTEGATNLYFTPARAQAAVTTITGNAGTATKLAAARKINGVLFDASSDINASEWVHSDRNFAAGTLVTTNINYAVSSGDPFILEIRGNSYGDLIPYDVQYQGYIYSDTIINHGGYSNGTPISGLIAINVGGNLCFWFPRQSYWNGFNIRVYSAYAGAVNRVSSITSTEKPSATKEVALSQNIRQSLHSGNFNSYAPTLTGGGASGNWNINITGNSASVGGLAVHAGRNNEANKVVRTDGNGYAYFGWINTDSGDNGRGGIARIYASNDSYIRYYTPVNFLAALNSSTYSREVNGGTLVPGTRYSIYTGGGAITMSMPSYADSVMGDEIEISNLHQTWAGAAFTITCPASNVKINMLTENLVCNHNAGGFTLECVYKDGTAAYWTVRT